MQVQVSVILAEKLVSIVPVDKRNFCVFLDQELGRVLEKDGWNVRWLRPKDEAEEPKPYCTSSC